jgi:non-homologous end joining protein Ku
MASTVWTGYLTFGLITIPVRLLRQREQSASVSTRFTRYAAAESSNRRFARIVTGLWKEANWSKAMRLRKIATSS